MARALFGVRHAFSEERQTLQGVRTVVAWRNPIEVCSPTPTGHWDELGARICELADLAVMLHLRQAAEQARAEEDAGDEPAREEEGES